MFEYSLPYMNELKELYPLKKDTKIVFHDTILYSIRFLITHPHYNRHYKLFNKHLRDTDLIDMAKPIYRTIQYYKDYPQQFNHNLTNLSPHMIKGMYSVFFGIHVKAVADIDKDIYYKSSIKKALPYFNKTILPAFLNNEPVVVSTRNQSKAKPITDKEIDALCLLANEELSSNLPFGTSLF